MPAPPGNPSGPNTRCAACPATTSGCSALADAILAPGERRRAACARSPSSRRRTRGSEASPEVSVRVTGFLPAAMLEESWEPGGSEFRPLVRFTTQIGPHVDEHLLGRRRGPQPGRGGRRTHRLASSGSTTRQARAAPQPRPAGDGARARLVPGGGSGRGILAGEVVLPGGYTLFGPALRPEWTMAGTGEPSMVLVRVHGPGRRVLRAPSSPRRPLSPGTSTPRATCLPGPADPDSSPAGQRGGAGAADRRQPDGLYALLVSDGGQVKQRAVTPGQPVEFLDGALKLTVWEASPHSRLVAKPRVVPRQRAGRQVGAALLADPGRAGRGRPAAGDAVGRVQPLRAPQPRRLLPAPRHARFRPAGRAALLARDAAAPGAGRAGGVPARGLPRRREGARLQEPGALLRERAAGPSSRRSTRNNPTEHAGWWYLPEHVGPARRARRLRRDELHRASASATGTAWARCCWARC